MRLPLDEAVAQSPGGMWGVDTPQAAARPEHGRRRRWSPAKKQRCGSLEGVAVRCLSGQRAAGRSLEWEKGGYGGRSDRVVNGPLGWRRRVGGHFPKALPWHGCTKWCLTHPETRRHGPPGTGGGLEANTQSGQNPRICRCTDAHTRTHALTRTPTHAISHTRTEKAMAGRLSTQRSMHWLRGNL